MYCNISPCKEIMKYFIHNLLSLNLELLYKHYLTMEIRKNLFKKNEAKSKWILPHLYLIFPVTRTFQFLLAG